MASEVRQLDLVLKLQDKASKELATFGSKVEKLSPTFGKMAGAGTAAFAGVAAGATLAINEAAKFESTMSDISTLISGDSTEAVNELSDGVKEMSKSMPTSIDELGGSLYDILSAGVQGSAEQLSVLENASKLATAGLGNTKGATDILTSSINAFGLEAGDADKISDVLFKTVKNGKTTVDQIAQSFGATAPILAAAGITLEEFSAATAALTTTGLPASIAQNQLRAATVALQAPTADMAKLFKKAGIESGQAALENDGLVETMDKVFKAAEGDAEVLKKAFGSVEALGAATSLTGDQNEAFTSTLNDMEEGANSVDEAFKKQSETFGSQMQVVKNQVSVLAISIGTELLPIIGDLIEKVKPFLEKLADWISKNPELTKNIILAAGAITGLISVVGTLGLVLPKVITGIKLMKLAMMGASGAKGVGGLIGALSSPVGLIAVFAVLATVAIVGAIEAWGNLKETQEEIKTSMQKVGTEMDAMQEKVGSLSTDEYNEQLQNAIDQTNELKKEAEDLANLGFFGSLGAGIKNIFSGGGGKKESVNDAIISPNGDIITTDPQDYLIATKTPGALAGGGGGGATVNIQGGVFLDQNSGRILGDLIDERLRIKRRI